MVHVHLFSLYFYDISGLILMKLWKWVSVIYMYAEILSSRHMQAILNSLSFHT